MSLKIKFIIYSCINGALVLGLSWVIFEEHRIIFFLIELLVFSLILYSAHLGNEIFKPIKMLNQGIQAIKDQDFQVKYQLTGNKEADRLIEVFNQMVVQLREERVVQRTQNFFLQKLIEASPAGILILSYDDEVISSNPAALELLDLPSEALLGQPVSAIDHPVLKEVAAMPNNALRTIELNGIRKLRCQSSTFIHKGFEQRFITLEDLSYELLETEKKAYGKVIRMMSHEVNNSMGAVNSLLDSLKYFAPSGEMKEDFDEAVEVAINRNDSLKKFMQNFASVIRLPQPRLEPLELNAFLQRMEALLKPECLQQQVQLSLQLPEQKLLVQADEPQLQQVLINVIKNAREAVREEQEHGRIDMILEENRLLIRNDGPAISPATAEKLFSPFFSTKTNGQGIGLTLCREILMNHHFPFRLFTADDGWTYFEIRLVEERVPAA